MSVLSIVFGITIGVIIVSHASNCNYGLSSFRITSNGQSDFFYGFTLNHCNGYMIPNDITTMVTTTTRDQCVKASDNTSYIATYSHTTTDCGDSGTIYSALFPLTMDNTTRDTIISTHSMTSYFLGFVYCSHSMNCGAIKYTYREYSGSDTSCSGVSYSQVQHYLSGICYDIDNDDSSSLSVCNTQTNVNEFYRYNMSNNCSGDYHIDPGYSDEPCQCVTAFDYYCSTYSMECKNLSPTEIPTPVPTVQTKTPTKIPTSAPQTGTPTDAPNVQVTTTQQSSTTTGTTTHYNTVKSGGYIVLPIRLVVSIVLFSVIV